MNNLDVRTAIMAAGLKNYQVAQKIGMAECNLSRLLREPLTEEKRNRIMEAIEELKSERGDLH